MQQQSLSFFSFSQSVSRKDGEAVLTSKRAVIVTGDRHARESQWENVVFNILNAIHLNGNDNAVLIHGAGTGIDQLASDIWTENWGSRHIRRHPAEWDLCYEAYSNRNMAGPLRNNLMLTELMFVRDMGYDAQVIAFHDALWSGSKGTRGMVKLARDNGIKTRIITSHGGPTR